MNDFVRQTKLLAGLSDFVFEKLPQGFDQREVHLFRQSPTLWWLLMSDAGLPPIATLSITSG